MMAIFIATAVITSNPTYDVRTVTVADTCQGSIPHLTLKMPAASHGVWSLLKGQGSEYVMRYSDREIEAGL
jgi:hypothetical protein